MPGNAEGNTMTIGSGNVPTRKHNEAVLDEKMNAAGYTYLTSEVNEDGSSTVTYGTFDGKCVQVRVRSDIVASESGE